LSPDKPRVFQEIFRVLKPGGELYFSDVFADRRIPENLAQDPLLLGECLGGALYFEDFRRILVKAGCNDYRVAAKVRISLTHEEIGRKIGMIDFYSLTFRAFKLDLEDRCEDYGQVAYYEGTIPECPHTFTLDNHHSFQAGKPFLVCGNTADMLSKTRFGPHFKIVGKKETHYGLFDCGPGPGSSEGTENQPCC
jgi:SAM-dependent methyltransferase